jgi:hypothetical protein
MILTALPRPDGAIGEQKRGDQHMRNVTQRHLSGLMIAAVNGWFVCATVCAIAAQIEAPPTTSAATVLGGQVRGTNYEIDDTVRGDGFLYIFSLNTNYGRYQVEGLDLLKLRLHELGAVATLEKMNKSQAYLDAASKAAMKPVNLATGLVTNPVGTVEQSMSGVGALFSRIGSSAANIGHDRDDVADSTLGVSSAKRKIANKLGVDPYTDFKPLGDALEDMARVTALGDLTVSGAFMAIPGGAGMAVSYSKTGQDVEQMMLDKTPSELRDVNKTKLSAMGVPDPAISAFLDNTFYTPTDQTIVVASLVKMSGVANRGLFVKRASQASNRNLAVFIRHRAQLLAAHHSRVEPFADFFDVRGLPLNRTRSGKVVIVVPFDELAWTKQASDLVAVIDQEVKQRKFGNSIEVRTTGTATPLARNSLSELGWKVFENISP